ncbi:copper-(or silver)-translocating P-type ATPase [Modestobacter sp. DSM 44400]|uniref:heavy metal translocating P-type ATPase n=1 Tax=Modestobacter sp. DSM 44400 TaxID=1550230 RepID=UPI0008955457|nr:cation-translocating P-type ATPase [Modestobacter sp. DSM 44400]SDY78490.1 copper-(or silver)-translocating P-type ATPase [Modestobacter sp. DSM 44400]
MSTQTEATEELWAEEPSSLAGHARIRARIAGLHCSLCTGTIEKALGRQAGVDKVAVSLTHEQALVDFDPAVIGPEEILGTLRDLGYDLYDPRKLRPFEEEEADLVREGKRLLTAIAASLTAIALILDINGIWSVLVPASVAVLMLPVSYAILRPAGRPKAVLGALGILAPAALAYSARQTGLLGETVTGWLTGALALAVIFGVAPHILRMAYQAARRRILNQHVLLEVGAFAGIAGGLIGLTGAFPNYPTAPFFAVTVLVANYHIFSEWLSLLVKTRSSQAVRKLLDLQPDTARVVRDGVERDTPIAQVAVGDVVRIRPGERVPVDGRVVQGYSTMDLSLVTGEPVPVERTSGSEVIGGSINGSGTLLVEVTRVGAESFLAQVVRHVEDARALKPGILHLVDRILRLYTPTVLAVSALAALGWLAGSWALAGEPDVRRAVFAGLGVLVMGYPCAVGIAAPLAIVRAAGEAADSGIIMRTGEAFQTFGAVRTMLLDKTGTLTEGRPAVREVEALIDEAELLAVAAAAESSSEHPLARAVVTAAADRGLALPAVSDFESVTGLGITATVAGARVLVGRPEFLTDRGVELTALHEGVTRLEAAGRTVVAVAADGRPLGLIALGDEIRPETAEAVAQLRAAGITPVLVTGDNARAARQVADRLGIDDVRAGVLPEGKAEIVREFQAGGARVAMVGDGINDAPALMQADVGIAMGGGTDIAVESADIIIVRNDLRAVLTAQQLSRSSYRRTRQNVALAFLFNGIGIPAATTGLIYPVWAMIAMAASVTTIFVNSIGGRPRLLFEAIASVGRAPADEPQAAAVPAAR